MVAENMAQEKAKELRGQYPTPALVQQVCGLVAGHTVSFRGTGFPFYPSMAQTQEAPKRQTQNVQKKREEGKTGKKGSKKQLQATLP